MRILISKYWKNFKKTIIGKDGKKKIVKDGKKFEELIKQEFRKQRIEPIFDRFYKSDEFEQGSGISYLQDHC